MCDIDLFKAYNDTYGHPAGDQALRTVAAVLTKQVRKGDRVYRYGGEEFLILLPEQGPEEATTALERVRSGLRALAIEHRGAGPRGVLTISAGLASSDPDRRTPSAELIAKADTALYEAKRNGRNRLALATTTDGLTPAGRLRAVSNTDTAALGRAAEARSDAALDSTRRRPLQDEPTRMPPPGHQ